MALKFGWMLGWMCWVGLGCQSVGSEGALASAERDGTGETAGANPEDTEKRDARVAMETATIAVDPMPAGLKDRGIFPDLDPKVTLRLAPWLEVRAPKLLVDADSGVATLYLDGLPVKAYPLTGPLEPAPASREGEAVRPAPASREGEAVRPAPASREGEASRPAPRLELTTLPLRPGDRAELERLSTDPLPVSRATRASHPHGDLDRDGIPDPVDVAIGAHKTALNGDDYRETYEVLKFPGGDVGRDHGVCTDVVIRAMRNAGLDLQVEIFRDMKAAPKRYRLGREKADRNIDHRRVRRLLPWFSHYYRPLGTKFDPATTGIEAWLPGDIVFLDTFPNRPGPDHIGIVSDKLGDDKMPLIINNWTDGYKTQEMALLGFVPVTHRFRPGLRAR